MKRRILIGSGSEKLGGRIASALGEEPLRRTTDVFPDGEIYVRIEEEIQRTDVFVIQSTGPPVAESLLELLLLADACRKAGALRLTAVVPYLGYARQDRRTQKGEALGARVATDLIGGRFDRILTVDLHNPSIEGFFTIDADTLTAVPLIAEALRPTLPADTVIVAPDLGAVKLAMQYAKLLQFPIAFVHKTRLGGDDVKALDVTGILENRTPLIVDDMISTGGTVIAAMELVLERGARRSIHIAATHGLFVKDALDRFAPFPVERIVISDSLELSRKEDTIPLEIVVVSLGEILADHIRAVSLKASRGAGRTR